MLNICSNKNLIVCLPESDTSRIMSHQPPPYLYYYSLLSLNTGFLFSGKITEPLNIEESMVNIKFNSNCIAVICPIRENAIKTWRLNHITSFGQSGGILTFECCSTCSDPGTSRCSINVIQEKSTTVLNLMEKAIRSNPNTSEIHYERSILGDIYHCDHECGQPQRLLPAYSDPNIFRSTSTSPQKEMMVVPIDIHEFEVGNSTISSGKSNDSGLPKTPRHQVPVTTTTITPGRGGSNTPSPSHAAKPRHAKISIPGPHHHAPPHVPVHGRSFSELGTGISSSVPDDDIMFGRRLTDPPLSGNSIGSGKMSVIDATKPQSSPKRRPVMEDSVYYATVKMQQQQDSTTPTTTTTAGPPKSPSHSHHRNSGGHTQKLNPVEENDGIYDTPFEPTYWEVADGALSPLGLGGANSQRSSRSESSTGTPITIKVTQSSAVAFAPDSRDRHEDFNDHHHHHHHPPVPRHRRTGQQQVKEMVTLFNPGTGQPEGGQRRVRSRLHSTGEVLDHGVIRSNPHHHHHHHRQDQLRDQRVKMRGSVDNLSHVGRSANPLANRNDLLSKLHEQDELLSKFLARSRNERNEELAEVRGGEDELMRPYKSFTTHEELDCVSPNNTRSGRSSASSDRVLTKVASDTVRGYAYKIQIPLSDTIYDVPRRAAPAPDLSNLRSDAPPKPQRRTTCTEP